jgi:hypothetical protein
MDISGVLSDVMRKRKRAMLKRIILLCLLFGIAVILSGCELSPPKPVPDAPTASPVPGELVSLSFSERNAYYARVQGYDFVAENGKYTAYFWMANEEEPYPVPVDNAWVDRLNKIVQHNKMLMWDGFHGTDTMLLDGTSFSISLAFSDGTTVHASGYGQFPDGYGIASEEIDAHFLQLLPEEMRDW